MLSFRKYGLIKDDNFVFEAAFLNKMMKMKSVSSVISFDLFPENKVQSDDIRWMFKWQIHTMNFICRKLVI